MRFKNKILKYNFSAMNDHRFPRIKLVLVRLVTRMEFSLENRIKALIKIFSRNLSDVVSANSSRFYHIFFILQMIYRCWYAYSKTLQIALQFVVLRLAREKLNERS